MGNLFSGKGHLNICNITCRSYKINQLKHLPTFYSILSSAYDCLGRARPNDLTGLIWFIGRHTHSRGQCSYRQNIVRSQISIFLFERSILTAGTMTQLVNPIPKSTSISYRARPYPSCSIPHPASGI